MTGPKIKDTDIPRFGEGVAPWRAQPKVDRPEVRDGWCTQDELRFIDGLGSFILKPPVTRPMLLRRYQAAMAKRRSWGRVSRDVVEQHLANALKLVP